MKRYSFLTNYGRVEAYESVHGDYVKWEDVQEILDKDEPEVLLHIHISYTNGKERHDSVIRSIGAITRDSIEKFEKSHMCDFNGVRKVKVLSFSKLDA